MRRENRQYGAAGCVTDHLSDYLCDEFANHCVAVDEPSNYRLPDGKSIRVTGRLLSNSSVPTRNSLNTLSVD